MNCKCTFTRRFLAETMGKTYVSRDLKAIEQESLLEFERTQLPAAQSLVAWEREFRRQKGLLRFGHRMTIPQRPQIRTVSTVSVDFFPCPVSECRGFVERRLGFTCGTCRVAACHMCRETAGPDHVCDPGVLSNIALILADSKPCPRCAVMINRSQGCDHMFCTHCRTHFHYVTGKVLEQSTNGHYNGLQAYRENVAVRVTDEGPRSGAGAGACNNVLMDVSRNVATPLARTARAIVRTIFEDIEPVRFILDRMYNAGMLNARDEVERINMRVEYLLGELSEDRWKSRLYTMHKAKERDTLIHNVLRMYLECVLRFQAEQQLVDESVVAGCCRAANESLASIADEFGMSHAIRIREPADSDDTPVIVN